MRDVAEIFNDMAPVMRTCFLAKFRGLLRHEVRDITESVRSWERSHEKDVENGHREAKQSCEPLDDMRRWRDAAKEMERLLELVLQQADSVFPIDKEKDKSDD